MFANWFQIVVPLLVFVTVVILGLWARLAIYKVINRQPQKTNLISNIINIKDIWNQFLIWLHFDWRFYRCSGIYFCPTREKTDWRGTGEHTGTFSHVDRDYCEYQLCPLYLNKNQSGTTLTVIASNIIKIIIIVISVLITLEIWGVPTFPIFIVLIAGIFILAFVFRHTLDNLLAGLEITYGEHIKVGDLIKLESMNPDMSNKYHGYNHNPNSRRSPGYYP